MLQITFMSSRFAHKKGQTCIVVRLNGKVIIAGTYVHVLINAVVIRLVLGQCLFVI